MANASDEMDVINRQAWSNHQSVRWFAGLEGWTDPGERVAIARVAQEARNQAILDLGVGAGRTVPLLTELSSDYVAIDYTKELVLEALKKHPDVCILDGDARDLSRFADESFQLVVFSNNGIDAVNRDDRLKVLAEVHRVLKKGGLFLFSVHNRNGPGHGERFTLGIFLTKNPVKLAWRSLNALVRLPASIRNFRRHSRLNTADAESSIMNASAHNHGIVIHYITLEGQLKQLEAHGFRPGAEVYDNVSGRRLNAGDDTSHAWWFHFIARK